MSTDDMSCPGASEVLQPTEIGMSVVLARSSGFLFIEFATVTQNDDRRWNGTYVPIDINPFHNPPSPWKVVPYHHNPPSPWKVLPYHRGLRPLLFTNSSVGYFMFDKNQNSELTGCETGRMVFRPYQRRLEWVTIYRCHNKGSTFSSVILRPWVLVRLRFEPTIPGGYSLI